ncbi:transient receptor potential cation channel subfamily V member 4 [Lingula anatina]|uniref:Transient receptor potential cation channel subfamily V member 4 n=1 Tax=Lingula anatina TaxID=7574 RepID=A0A1S3H3C3_LINAN|nr:transient receptor potential cation channel subfamily V member 4 [Lingula anatina]|eukprot:XP_013379634.1 transient receptor potential cation channel subfamily V member 4 [Lingula anatina]
MGVSIQRDDFFEYILRGDIDGLQAVCRSIISNIRKNESGAVVHIENDTQPASGRPNVPPARRRLRYSDSNSVHPESQGKREDEETNGNLLFQPYPSTEENPTEGTLLEGGLPLVVAACNIALPERTQKKIIDILMETANDIFTAQNMEDLFPLKWNKKGNNVFHELVRLSIQPWVELLVQGNTIDSLDSTIVYPMSPLKNGSTFLFNEEPKTVVRPLYIERIQAIMRYILNKPCKLDKDEVKEDVILFQRNKKGYTPLELAVKVGSVHLASYLLEMEDVHKVRMSDDSEKYRNKRLVHRDFVYRLAPLKEITEDLKVEQRFDELFVRKDGALSLMECITVNKGAKAIEFVNIVPLSHAIAEQWDKRFKIHVIWGIAHLLTTVALSICASFRPAPSLHVDEGNHTYQHLSIDKVTGIYTSGGDYVRAAFEIVVVLYAIALLITELVVLVQKGVFRNSIKMLTKVRANERYSVVFILYSIFTITAAVLRAAAFDYEEIFLTIAVILSWWSLIHFLRPFKRFALYTVMIQKVMFSDIFRFSLLFLFQLVGYTTAFQVMFEGVENPPEEYSSFSQIMFHLFKITIGLGDVGLLNEVRYPGLSIVLFVSFVLVSYIFLFNMVIAMMSETVRVVAENRKLQWRLQQLHVLIFIERRLLPKFRRNCMVIIDQPCIPSIVNDVEKRLSEPPKGKRKKKEGKKKKAINDSGYGYSPLMDTP